SDLGRSMGPGLRRDDGSGKLTRGFEDGAGRVALRPFGGCACQPGGGMLRSPLPARPDLRCRFLMADNIIVDTATRIFADRCEAATINEAEKGTWPTALWNALEENGLSLTWVPDNLGGAGAEMLDGFAVLRAAGRAAAPVPLAETLMAGWLLAQAGVAAPPGPMTIAPVHEDGNLTIDAGGRLAGRSRPVPFARQSQHVAIVARRDGAPVVALVETGALGVTPGTNRAGEPQDMLSFDGATAV